jgi:hypothetical protein
MVLWKTTVVLIAGGLTGSGLVVFTRSGAPPEQLASATEAAASSDATLATTSDELSRQQGHIHARFAAQRPFACFSRVAR